MRFSSAARWSDVVDSGCCHELDSDTKCGGAILDWFVVEVPPPSAQKRGENIKWSVYKCVNVTDR